MIVVGINGKKPWHLLICILINIFKQKFRHQFKLTLATVLMFRASLLWEVFPRIYLWFIKGVYNFCKDIFASVAVDLKENLDIEWISLSIACLNPYIRSSGYAENWGKVFEGFTRNHEINLLQKLSFSKLVEMKNWWCDLRSTRSRRRLWHLHSKHTNFTKGNQNYKNTWLKGHVTFLG